MPSMVLVPMVINMSIETSYERSFGTCLTAAGRDRATGKEIDTGKRTDEMEQKLGKSL